MHGTLSRNGTAGDVADAAPGRFRPFDWMRAVNASSTLTSYDLAACWAMLGMQHGGKIEAASAERIAAKARMPTRTAERSIAALRKAGLIEIVTRYGAKGRLANGFRLVSNGAGDRTRCGQVTAHGAERGDRTRCGAITESIRGTVTPYGRLMRDGEASRLSTVQRAAALAAQASAHRRANGADPITDC